MSRLVTALLLIGCSTASADSPSNWWTSKPEHHAGKISQHVRFTIDVPRAVEQSWDRRSSNEFSFQGDTGSVLLTVSTIPEPETFEQFKKHYTEDDILVIEEDWKTGYGILSRTKGKDDDLMAIFINVNTNPDSGGSQTQCRWLTNAKLKGKTLPAWDAMKKACKSIAITYQ
jgi:hypothetical protein